MLTANDLRNALALMKQEPPTPTTTLELVTPDELALRQEMETHPERFDLVGVEYGDNVLTVYVSRNNKETL